MAKDDAPELITTWPHVEGVVRLCYSKQGHKLYSGGSESYIRVFTVDHEEGRDGETELIEYHTEGINGLDCSNEYLCSAEDDGRVALHAVGSNDLVALITRSTLPARGAVFDHKGKRVAVVSDESIVKVIDVQDTEKIQILTGHTKAVRSAAWSPDGRHLIECQITTSTDGSLRVWDVSSSNEASCIKVLENVICVDQPESHYNSQAVWHPSGKWFAVEGAAHEIVVISAEKGWSRDGIFSSSAGHTSEISALAISVNGLYLASSGKEGLIIIWNCATREIVTSMPQSKGLITSLAFRPAPATANELAFADDSGQMTRWLSPLPSNLPTPAFMSSNSSKSTTEARQRGREALFRAESQAGDSDVEGAKDSDDDDEDAEALKRLEADEEQEGAGWVDDDLGLDGIGMGYGEMNNVGKKFGKKSKGGREGWERLGDKFSSGDGGTHSSSVVIQKSFQPGSTTPVEGRRYLAFNMLGFIHTLEREDRNIVTIEFHDRAGRLGTHFDDLDKCTLGALGNLGAIFSSPASLSSPCLIHYHPFISWSPLHLWTYPLPAGESVVSLTITSPSLVSRRSSTLDEEEESGTVVVGTDKGFLRFFTTGGVQKYVWQIGGQVLAMACGSELLLVLSTENTGAVGYTVLDVESFEVLQEGKVPSAAGSICWVGFTDDDIPAIYSTKGLLSLLDRARRPRQARWVPALDANALAKQRESDGRIERYWPIGVGGKEVSVIILKGSDRQPGFPTPLFQELEMQFPLLRLDLQQGQLEEQYLRETLFVSHRRDGCPSTDFSQLTTLARAETEADKSLLKLIQLLCKAEHLSSALDAVHLLTQPASLAAAGKIAGFFRLSGLEERIERIRESKREREIGAAGKREGKWDHLVDTRTVVSSTPPPASSWALGKKKIWDQGALSSSMAAPSTSRSTGPGIGKGKRKSNGFVAPQTVSYEQNDEDDEALYGKNVDDEDQADEEQENGADEEERAAKRMKSVDAGEEMELEYADEQPEDIEKEQEMEEQQMEVEQPVMPKKPMNPFAKKAAAPKPDRATPSSRNPFPAKKNAGEDGKTLQKKGSFFNRVEGNDASEGRTPSATDKTKAKSSKASTSKAAATATSTGPRQTTLFGMAPGVVKPKERKARVVAESAETSNGGGIASVLAKQSKGKQVAELPREGEEFADTQVDEADTQLEDTQITAKGKEVEAQAVQEAQEASASAKEGEEEMEDTQVESQVDSQVVAPAGDAASKLARFRMQV